MKGIQPEVWDKLSSSSPRGQTLAARIAAPNISSRLFAAIDVEGRRHLLIVLIEDEDTFTDKESRGVQVETRDLKILGNKAARYIDIVCIDPIGHDIFDLIGSEIAQELKQNERASESVHRVLAKWRRFWGQLPKEMLSRNDQLGLFAELWFLSEWMVPLTGPSEAVYRWRGPTGSRHDFEWKTASVEVKATTSVRGRIHHINGIEQLVPPEEGILYFFSLRLRGEMGAVNSLPSLIAACRKLIEIDIDAIEDFETKLLQAGYSPAHEDEYAKLHLRVVDQQLYEVGSEFPQVIPNVLLNGVPSGVEFIEYDINLNGFDHLLVGRDVLIQKDH